MRNILKASATLVLLAAQVHGPLGGAVAAADTANANAAGVYEVKLNTNTASAVELVGPKKPDYEAEVLAPLRAAQAEAARKVAEAAAAKKRRIVAKVATKVAAPVAGSHTDWMREAGIAESDFGYVDYIISHESGWVATKSNYRGSGAYGLGQAYPASKMAAYGSDYLTNPVTQLKWADAYAKGRYGSWAAAYSHWLSHHNW
jgi:hypothetical protein